MSYTSDLWLVMKPYERHTMDYYVHLCREQNARLDAFRDANPGKDELTIRQEFFGQRYEATISATIIGSIPAIADYEATKARASGSA